MRQSIASAPFQSASSLMRYSIDLEDPSPQFLGMFNRAGYHFQSLFEPGQRSWLKMVPHPPFLEHLSFFVGNQVFFVRLEDVDGRVPVPGTRSGLISIAEGWNGWPCLLPMRRNGTRWETELGGWGLLDARTGDAIDPYRLVNDRPVAVTDWELGDFAVKVVRDWLEAQGRRIMSSHFNPDVDPNIWFVGDKGPEWVIVRAARYPETIAPVPANWRSIAEASAHVSRRGNFASVAFASLDKPHDPILRGHPADAEFEALIPLEL